MFEVSLNYKVFIIALKFQWKSFEHDKINLRKKLPIFINTSKPKKLVGKIILMHKRQKPSIISRINKFVHILL